MMAAMPMAVISTFWFAGPADHGFSDTSTLTVSGETWGLAHCNPSDWPTHGRQQPNTANNLSTQRPQEILWVLNTLKDKRPLKEADAR